MYFLCPLQVQKGSRGRRQDQCSRKEIQRRWEPEESLAGLGLGAQRDPEAQPLQRVFRLWLLHVAPSAKGPRGLRTPQGRNQNGRAGQASRAAHPPRDRRHVLRDQDHGRPWPGRQDPRHLRTAVRQIRQDLWQSGGNSDESPEAREGGVWGGDAVAGPGWWRHHHPAGVIRAFLSWLFRTGGPVRRVQGGFKVGGKKQIPDLCLWTGSVPLLFMETLEDAFHVVIHPSLILSSHHSSLHEKSHLLNHQLWWNVKGFWWLCGCPRKGKTTKPNQVIVESADVLSSLRSSRAASGGQTESSGLR